MSEGFTTLISTTQLASAQASGEVRVFDCRHDLRDPDYGSAGYAAGHIPGAQFLNLDRDLSGEKTGRNGRHPLPGRTRLAARLGDLGVGDATQVVAYDDMGGMFAARLWWLLRWLGHKQVAVLDGGLQAWVDQGLELTRDVPHYPRAEFQIRDGAAALPVKTVLKNLGSPSQLIIDARSPDRYRGENETLDPVGGHIPGASNRFFKDNLGSDQRFKSAQELRADFAAIVGNIAAQSVVHQCGSGVTACHNVLAMEVAGLTGSQLYAGSWSEWCADPSRPVATGA